MPSAHDTAVDRIARIGQKLGSWTLLEYLPASPGQKNWYYRCRCDCGATHDVQGKALVGGRSKQCAKCAHVNRRTILAGNTYSNWTVIQPVIRGDRIYRYECRCVCGRTSLVMGAHLQSGKSKGCRKCADLASRTGISKSHWGAITTGAKNRGLPVTMTWDDAERLFNEQGGKCRFTGLPITLPATWIEFKSGQYSASLDRIDSSRGYELDNVQWLHRDVNYMKMDLPEERFLELCRLIVKAADAKHQAA